MSNSDAKVMSVRDLNRKMGQPVEKNSEPTVIAHISVKSKLDPKRKKFPAGLKAWRLEGYKAGKLVGWEDRRRTAQAQTNHGSTED